MEIGMEVLSEAYKVAVGIYGVLGLTTMEPCLTLTKKKVRAGQMIRENSRSAFLVLDHSKFGRDAHVRGGKVDEATKIP